MNVITEETLLINIFHRDDYKESKATIHTHNGLSIPPIGCITLLVLVGPRVVDTSLVIILESNLFRVKLGISWMVSMNGVASIIHKCLKFSHESFVHIVHIVHNTHYKPLVSHGGFSLDHFWPALVIPLPLRIDLLYHAYFKYKIGGMMQKLTYPISPYTILVKFSMIMQQ